MAARRDRMDAPRRRVADFRRLTDPQLFDTYVETLRDPRNINYSPYLVTAIGEAGLWERLASEESRRRQAQSRGREQ